MSRDLTLTSLFKNQIFLAILLLWMVSAVILGNLSTAIVTVTALLLAAKRRYLELFLGFAVLLFLADSRQSVFSFAQDSRDIYAIIMALCIIFDKRFHLYKKFYSYFLPFFLVAVIALYFSPYPVYGALKTISYFLILLIVPNYVTFLYERHGTWLFKQLISLAFIILLVGILFSFINPDFVYLAGRYNGLLGNPNGMGLFVMLMTILVELSYNRDVFEGFKKERLIFLIVAFLTLILSGSRTAMMGLILFYYFRFSTRVSTALTFVSIVFIILFFQFIVQYLPVMIRDLGLQEFARLETLESMSGRAVAFEFAWSRVQENFWLGRGFAYSEYVFGQWEEYLSRLGHQGGTHNTYLTIWLNTGLIGVVMFLIGWISLFIKASKVTILAIPVGLTIIFSTFFESWLSASLNAYTIILLIILTFLTIPNVEDEYRE